MPKLYFTLYAYNLKYNLESCSNYIYIVLNILSLLMSPGHMCSHTFWLFPTDWDSTLGIYAELSYTLAKQLCGNIGSPRDMCKAR